MTPENAAVVVLERTVELARVPAPPLDEADRAEVVTGWWRRDGLEPHIDPVGNVVARLRAGRGPAIFVAAHLDTVFGRDVPHGTEQRSGRLHGVGVGDNTVAVAALSVMDRLLPRDLDRPVWIAATVGEEGFGNLTGARHLVEHPPAEIGAMVALEGNYLGRVVTIGVGSVRWLAELEGPGGHAWEAADNPSAIHDLARIITGLERLLPDARNQARCSLNVGHIEGGESINARARRAALQIDIRSADPVVLADLDAAARRLVYHGEVFTGNGELQGVGETTCRFDPGHASPGAGCGGGSRRDRNAPRACGDQHRRQCRLRGRTARHHHRHHGRLGRAHPRGMDRDPPDRSGPHSPGGYHHPVRQEGRLNPCRPA